METPQPAEGDLGRFVEPFRPLLVENDLRRIFTGKDETIAATREAFFIRPDEPLTGAIHSAMTARSVAALRIAEAGRRLLQEGHYTKALVRLERALAIDANPYTYYYLAQLHYRLTHYQQSLNFLEVAESRLRGQGDWSTEVSALKDIVRSGLWSSRLAVKPDATATVKEPLSSVTEAQSEPRMKTEALLDADVSRKQHHLLIVDLLVLSFGALGFLAVIFVSTLHNLRPR